MDVTLPDGTTITGVPEGTTKEQLAARLQAAGRTVPPAWLTRSSAVPAGSDTAPKAPAPEDQGWLQAAQNVAEAGATMVTGLGATVLGAGAGYVGEPIRYGAEKLAEAAGLTSGPVAPLEPHAIKQKIQEEYTYRPSAKSGERLVQTLGKPIEVAKNIVAGGAGRLGEAVGGREVGQNVEAAVGDVFDIAAPALPVPKLIGRVASKAAEATQAVRSFSQRVIDPNIVRVNKAGYKVSPQAAGEPVAGTVQGLADSTLVDKQLSLDNNVNATKNVAAQIGLGADHPITPTLLDKLDEQHLKVYQEVDRQPDILVPRDTTIDLGSLEDFSGASQFKHSAKPEIAKFKANLIKDLQGPPRTVTIQRVNKVTGEKSFVDVALPGKPRPIPVKDVMGRIRSLRQEGGQNLRVEDADKNALGSVQLQAAKILEDSVETHLENIAKKDSSVKNLLARFREARKGLAQDHVVRTALGEDGHLSIQQIGKYDAATGGQVLTGALKEAAHFGRSFPRLSQDVGKLGNVGAFGKWDLAMAAFGHTLGAALPVGKYIARAQIRSPKMQANIARRAAAREAAKASLTNPRISRTRKAAIASWIASSAAQDAESQ